MLAGTILLIFSLVLFSASYLEAANSEEPLTTSKNATSIVNKLKAEFIELRANVKVQREIREFDTDVSNALDKVEVLTSKRSGRSISLPEEPEPLHRVRNQLAVLTRHDVTQVLQREIIGMSSARTPREDIIAHVKTHYPTISDAEAADIVTATHVVAGRQLPAEKSFMKAAELKMAKNMDRFKKALADRKVIHEQ